MSDDNFKADKNLQTISAQNSPKPSTSDLRLESNILANSIPSTLGFEKISLDNAKKTGMYSGRFKNKRKGSKLRLDRVGGTLYNNIKKKTAVGTSQEKNLNHRDFNSKSFSNFYIPGNSTHETPNGSPSGSSYELNALSNTRLPQIKERNRYKSARDLVSNLNIANTNKCNYREKLNTCYNSTLELNRSDILSINQQEYNHYSKDLEQGAEFYNSESSGTDIQVSLSRFHKGNLSVARKQKLLVTFGKCLSSYGAPTYRLESSLARMTKHLELQASSKVMPGFILMFFDEVEQHKAKTLMIKTTPGYDFYKLSLIDALFEDVIQQRIKVGKALEEIKIIENIPDLYPWYIRFLAACINTMSLNVIAYHGNWMGLLISFMFGVLVNGSILAAGRFKGFQNVNSFVSSFVSAFLIMFFRKSVCFESLIMSAISPLLPGLDLSVGIIEIMAKSSVPGTVRLFQSLVTLMVLTFSVQMGVLTYNNVKNIDDMPKLVGKYSDCKSISEYYKLIFLPLSMLCNCIKYNIYKKRIPMCMIIASSMYSVLYFVGKYADAKNFATVLGSFVAGLLSNLAGKYLDTPPFVPLVVSIGLLVPGSLGLQSSFALMYDESISGLFVQVIKTCIAIMIGVFISSFLVYPRGKNSAAFLTL
ncbi:hypothetical protein BB561_005055 [Smittium simulii]|uniref:Threonine/serine exporter-like N-terminal domain-containing protein n=1 Tax=Smittium simulii TaxID=133385 RepID=A0A2T9YCH2_9FUNG|nr:hypothetical protein BB561_005055 [Smittium simulii]